MNTGKCFRAAVVLVGLLAGLGTGLHAQQTFGTTIYFDWTRYLSDNGPLTTAPPNTPSFKNDFFAFRRAYFTYENKINDNLKFRFRYDADNTANLTSVDSAFKTKKDDKLRPFVKHIYLEYANLVPRSVLRVGMTETLTFKPAEERWGYRSVAKTLVDGFKDITGVEIDATSADLGVSFTGSVNKYLRYGLMISNGSHYSHVETDGWKKLMAQATVVPVAGFSLVGYWDYEKQAEGKDAQTYKLDGLFEMVKGLVLGAEYFVYQNDLYLAGTDRFDVSGFSLFGRYAIQPDKLNAFARFDSYEPNSKVDKDQKTLIIAGLDWAPWHSSIKFQPNIWIYSYQDSAKKNDLIFNMTFFMSF
jgi:hypothetical protein